MPTALLVFEFLGTSELMIIAVVALIIFGPRKLPEIGRSLGRTLSEFKRASEDFKRTWEYEVELEQRSAPQTQPAGGVEAVSGGGAAGDMSAGAVDEGGTVARGASWGDVKPQVYVPVGGDIPADFVEGAAEAKQDDAMPQDDAAQPDAPEPAGEDSTAPSEGHTGPGEPRDS